MSDLTRGAYHLRASPAVAPGGMYAMFDGPDKPVLTGALVPDLMHRLMWRFEPVEGKDRTYKIFVEGVDIIPSAWGFKEQPRPDQPVFLTYHQHEQVEWLVQHINVPGAENAHTFLRVNPPIEGAAWYAGTEGNTVVYKVLPIDAPDHEKPYWALNHL